MNDLQDNLRDAGELAKRMVGHIDQALAAVDLAETQMHLRRAMLAGEEMEILLADSAFESDEQEVTSNLEAGLSKLRQFFKQGIQALSGEPEVLAERIRTMKPVAVDAIEHIHKAGLPLGIA